jgi:hypothetical protein
MKLLCLLMSIGASSVFGMEPLITKQENNKRELLLEWQISLADGKQLMADYDNKCQTITLLELAHGGAKPVGLADMKDLVSIDELSNIKVLGLARLPQPQEYITLLLANKKTLQDTLVCMRVDLNENRERIKAVQFYSPLSKFTQWRLTLDETHTQLTILARALTPQKNVYEEHEMPVYLAQNEDFLVATATTKHVVRNVKTTCAIL